MRDYAKNMWRLTLTIAAVIAVAWAPYLVTAKTLLASASDSASLYSTGASPTHDPGTRVIRSLDSGASAWQNEPWLALEHRLIVNEHVMPMWDPYDGYGVPFAASMLPQPFYPLAFATALLPGPRTYNVLVIGRLFFVALGCAFFVLLFAGFVPALVAGICVAFSAYFIVFADIVHVGVEIMLPWMLIGVELVVRRPTSRRAAVLAAASGISLLGGMPESSALAGLVVAGYALFRLFLARGDRLTGARLAWLCGGAAAGVAIGAIMLLPFWEYAGQDFDVHQPSPPGLAHDTFLPRILLTELAPLAFGPPWNSIISGFSGHSGMRGAPGGVAILLAMLAATAAIGAFKQRLVVDRVALFMVIAGIAFEAKRFGLPLLSDIGALPIFRLILFPKYGEADLAVCFAIAAGLGAAALCERRVRCWSAIAACAVVLGIVTWCYVATVLPPATVQLEYYYGALGFLLILLGATAVVAWYLMQPQSLQRWAYALAVLAFVEGTCAFFAPMYYVIDEPAPASRDPYLPAPYISFLQTATASNGARIFASSTHLFPDWSSAFGLYDTRDLSAMYPSRYIKFIDALVVETLPVQDPEELHERFIGNTDIDFNDPRVQRWLSLSSVGYVVTTYPLPPPPAPHEFLADLWAQNGASISPAQLPAVHPTAATIGGITEAALLDHPPSTSITYATPLRAGFKWLAVDAALDPSVWDACGGAVTFSVDARDASGRTVGRALRTIDPKHVAADRRWNRMTLDLRAVRGKVQLSFATSVPPPGDTCAAAAIWGAPRWTAVEDRHPYVERPHPGTVALPDVGDATITRIDGSLARLTLFHRVLPVASGAAALAAVTQPFDERKTVIIEGHAPATGSGASDQVQLISRTSQSVEAEVATNSDAVLMQNDTWYPGWRATVDGIETPILRADYLFRGIAVPAGHHRVVIAYRSPVVLAGEFVSLAGSVALLLMLAPVPVLRRFKRSRLLHPAR